MINSTIRREICSGGCRKNQKAHAKRRDIWRKTLFFPPAIAPTNPRPDLVLWSSSVPAVDTRELIVPSVSAVEEASEQKSQRYAELAAEPEQQGWKARVSPAELGCRGFVSRSVTSLNKDMGV